MPPLLSLVVVCSVTQALVLKQAVALGLTRVLAQVLVLKQAVALGRALKLGQALAQE